MSGQWAYQLPAEPGRDPHYERIGPKAKRFEWEPYAILVVGLIVVFIDQLLARVVGALLIGWACWEFISYDRNAGKDPGAVTLSSYGLIFPFDGNPYSALGRVPWGDIERFEVVDGPYGTKFAGIVLRSYDRLVASVDPAAAAALVRNDRRWSRLMAPLAVFLALQGKTESAELGSAAAGSWSVDSLAALLANNRRQSGADVLLNERIYDRSPHELVAYLERKRTEIASSSSTPVVESIAERPAIESLMERIARESRRQ